MHFSRVLARGWRKEKINHRERKKRRCTEKKGAHKGRQLLSASRLDMLRIAQGSHRVAPTEHTHPSVCPSCSAYTPSRTESSVSLETASALLQSSRSQAWWCTPKVPAPGRWRQEDCRCQGFTLWRKHASMRPRVELCLYLDALRLCSQGCKPQPSPWCRQNRGQLDVLSVESQKP